MKSKRFKKVVKWISEPEYGLIIMGIGIMIIGLVALLLPVFRNKFDLLLFISGLGSVAGGIAFITFGSGEGKKVYWEEIKGGHRK